MGLGRSIFRNIEKCFARTMCLIRATGCGGVVRGDPGAHCAGDRVAMVHLKKQKSEGSPCSFALLEELAHIAGRAGFGEASQGPGILNRPEQRIMIMRS